MEIVNLTPHDIVLYLNDGTQISYPSKGVLRCTAKFSGKCGEIQVTRTQYADIYDAPEYVSITPIAMLDDYKGKYIIVSMPVGNLLKAGGWLLKKALGLGAVLGPDTSPENVIRDDKGRIIGTKNFIKYI